MVNSSERGVVTTRRKGPRRKAGRPPVADGERTRAQLIQAAIECFAHSGLARTTLRQIADAAGLSSGTLYHYFASKKDLYFAAYRWAVEETYRGYRTAADPHETVEEKLEAVLELFRENYYERNDIGNFILRAWVEHDSTGIEPLPIPESVMEFMDALFDAGVKSGEVTAADKDALIDTFRCMAWGVWALTLTGRSPDEAIDGFKRLVTGRLVRKKATGQKRRQGKPKGSR